MKLPAFTQPDRSRRAFFVTYGASHIAKVAPVVRELESRGVECIVMALTIAYRQAMRLGLHPVGYKDFVGLRTEGVEAVMAAGRALIDGVGHPDVDETETCCYLGINHLDSIDELGLTEARAAYARRGRHGFMPVRFMGQVLDALQPGVVVATSTPRSEEACIRAAALRGIPSLTMVDLFVPAVEPFQTRPVHASRVTVVSYEVRQRLLAAGLDSTQVVVTGSPDFDTLFEEKAAGEGSEIRRRLGWEGRTVVLWAGVLEPDDSAMPGTRLGIEVQRVLSDWSRDHAGSALVFRYHPSQHHVFPPPPAAENVHVSRPDQESIEAVLQLCDVVIHQVSTVGFQAALLGKRVLHLEFSAWHARSGYDMSSLGPSEAVADLQSLVPVLAGGAPPARKSGMLVPQGPAAPRVADEIERLLIDGERP